MRTEKPLSRRDLLRLSSLGVLGLPASGLLAELAAREAAQSSGGRTSKSCILLYMSGGQSHIDTFDPKPENKTSQFKSIATSIPGVQFADHLPRLAAMADRLALLRGMST